MSSTNFIWRGAKRLLEGMFAVLAALWVFAEEWLWNTMLAFMRRLARLRWVRIVEIRVARLSPYAALTLFVVPALLLLPFKLAAFWMMANGHGGSGISLFVIAKIIGAAVLARIFTLTRRQLLRVGWFAWLYFTFIRWRAALYAYVSAMPLYSRCRAAIRRARLRIRHFLRI